jgi:hypothetical protein
MNIPWWVAELAAAFWEQAGEEEPFPRTLREPIIGAFPLAVLARPSLSVECVRKYLCRRHIAFPLEGMDRPLRACLVARDGGGAIFLDSGDEAAEQRFSLAHELAHFLRHYWQPRRQAQARLGGAILEVFDGRRPARQDERLDALLAGVPLGFHTHLMERDTGSRPKGVLSVAEEEADRLAYELLAPAKTVAARLGGLPADERRARAAADLRDFFGLPAKQASDYSAILVPAAEVDPLLSWLGRNS